MDIFFACSKFTEKKEAFLVTKEALNDKWKALNQQY